MQNNKYLTLDLACKTFDVRFCQVFEFWKFLKRAAFQHDYVLSFLKLDEDK